MTHSYHPTSEKLVDILCTKTQNHERLFFRVMLAYYWGVIASQQRVTIHGFGGKDGIPVNVYAINLSPSGTGKGFSTSLMETEVIHKFKQSFLEHTFPIKTEDTIALLAQRKAKKSKTLYDTEWENYHKEFANLGSPLMIFDSATTPAVKQLRQKLLMAGVGSLSLMVDEIGSNLLSQKEVLNTFLELYDKGLVKEKLVKSTKDDVRFEKIEGATPANILLFGTPTKLLDGDITERALYEMLETGYARRCLFGFVTHACKNFNITAQDVYHQMFNQDTDEFLELLAEQLEQLADMSKSNTKIKLSESVALQLLDYRLTQEKKASQYKEHQSILKAEMEHRYFKALKLAGAYAFIDGSDDITSSHLKYAIQLVEDSGVAFQRLLSPERPYVKLAKYLAQYNTEMTLADLDEDLAYFRGSKTQKEELITLAIAWGYKNNIVIKKIFSDGVQFLKGESLEETNLDKLMISVSQDMTYSYQNTYVTWQELSDLGKQSGFHWLNHFLVNGDNGNGHRNEDNCFQGFNLLVLDIDGTCSLSKAKLLLQKYKALYYTTKRHTDEVNRFRIILPLNYTLYLDAKEYKEFFNNILQTLPFMIDSSCNHRSKKWLSHAGQVEYTDGELFDVLPYIPKTSKNEEREQQVRDLKNLDAFERWVLNNIGDGNRNVQLHKYAMLLVDAGHSLAEVTQQVTQLNNKIADKLSQEELDNTIFKSVAKRF